MSLLHRDHGYALRCGPRWVFWYARERRFVAAIRTIWFTLVRGHIGEACQECGRPYVLWWASDEIYATVTGRGRFDNGEAAPGLYCLECFDGKAERLGIVLQWRPEIFRVKCSEGDGVSPIPWSSPIPNDVVDAAYCADPSAAIIERVNETERAAQ